MKISTGCLASVLSMYDKYLSWCFLVRRDMPAVFLADACKIHESILDSWTHPKVSISTQKSRPTNAVNSKSLLFYNHQASKKLKFNLGIVRKPTWPFLSVEISNAITRQLLRSKIITAIHKCKPMPQHTKYPTGTAQCLSNKVTVKDATRTKTRLSNLLTAIPAISPGLSCI